MENSLLWVPSLAGQELLGHPGRRCSYTWYCLVTLSVLRSWEWQLLERHRDDSTGDSYAWEYNEKYDMQKLTNYVKSNLRSEMSQSKRFQHTGPKVSLCNRAQPFAGSHCCALLLCILLLGNRACSSIGQCLMDPTHKQPTITELPAGTCPAQLLVRPAMGTSHGGPRLHWYGEV